MFMIFLNVSIYHAMLHSWLFNCICMCRGTPPNTRHKPCKRE